MNKSGKKYHYKGGIETNDNMNKNTNNKSDYGSGVLSLSFGLLAKSLEWLSDQALKLGTFISNNTESVFYHFVFLLSYIICLTTIKNTNNENVRFIIITFILILHIIFLFAALNTDVTIPSILKNVRITLFSPYFFGTGWLVLFVSICLMVSSYSNLYKTYTQNRMQIDFASLDSDKNNYLNYLIAASVWMWIFYIIERIKPLFFDFFNNNSIMNTFILIIGAVFIAISAYSLYLSFNIANSIQKINLPPLDSIDSFSQYFTDLANEGAQNEYNSYKEGFDNTNDSKNEDSGTEDILSRDSTKKLLSKVGIDMTDDEITTNGLSLNEYCDKQLTNNTNISNSPVTNDSKLNLFLLSKSNKDLYYITNNPKYSSNIPDKVDNKNNANTNNIIILSYSSGYKQNTQNEFTMTNASKYNGVYLLDHANNIYNIQTKDTQNNKVTVSIYPGISGLQSTSINTPIGTNSVGTFLLAPDNSDLFYIKTQYTSTNSVEIYCLDIDNKYQKFSVNTGTPFLLDGTNSCTWKAPLDLKNPVDKTYMNSLDVSDSSFNLIGGVGTYLLNSNRDLYFIKTADTDSKMIEIHGLSAESKYQSFCAHYITGLRLFNISDDSVKPVGNKWAAFGVGTFDFDSDDNLVYIKPTTTDSDNIISSLSIFTLSASSNYKKFI